MIDCPSNPLAVHVLMYHSVSDGPGPTCIPLRTFREQMAAIDRQSYQVVSLAEFTAWHDGERELPNRVVVLTFDDGFADFAETAFPELKARGWTATVFIPTSLVGEDESWQGRLPSPRRLMSWSQIEELAGEGIDFGSHAMTHPDLTRLDLEQARREIREPRDAIQQRLGGPPTISFAPPYGRCNEVLRNEIRKWYRVSVGVTLQRAGRHCDRYDVPRLEMHYFRNIRLWNAFLDGRADWYLAARRVVRKIRDVV